MRNLSARLLVLGASDTILPYPRAIRKDPDNAADRLFKEKIPSENEEVARVEIVYFLSASVER